VFCRLLFVLFPLFVLGYCIVWFFPLELRLLITPLLSSNLLSLFNLLYCRDLLRGHLACKYPIGILIQISESMETYCKDCDVDRAPLISLFQSYIL